MRPAMDAGPADPASMLEELARAMAPREKATHRLEVHRVCWPVDMRRVGRKMLGFVVMAIFLAPSTATAQEPEYESERQLPLAPPDMVRTAEHLLIENFGREPFERFVTLRSARTYPPGKLNASAVHAVSFNYRIEGPDYLFFHPVSLWLDDADQVVSSSGVVNCRDRQISCPPFRTTRAAAIAIARRAGLKPGKESFCLGGEFVQGYWTQLYFHPRSKRFVWSVRNKRPRWRSWESWLPRMEPKGSAICITERGKEAIIDANGGEVYELQPWIAFVMYAPHP